MAAKTQRTIKSAFDIIQGTFETWKTRGSQIRNRLVSGNVQADNLANQIWHEVRRTKEILIAVRNDVDSIGSTPTDGRNALKSFADSMYAESYDILSEAQTFVGLLNNLQATTATVLGGVDAQGFVQGPYIKLTNTGPFFREFTPAETASIVSDLDAVIAHVS